MALLLAGWTSGARAGPGPGQALEGEKLIIILAAWLLMFSMFLGLSPSPWTATEGDGIPAHAAVLQAPAARHQIPAAPAAVAFFYIVFTLLYRLGEAANSAAFSLFSASVISPCSSYLFPSPAFMKIHRPIHLAGLALGSYLTLGSLVMALACLEQQLFLGSVWRFAISAISSTISQACSRRLRFFSCAGPIRSLLFLAFDKFDLRPPGLQRRHLLFFAPLFSCAGSLPGDLLPDPAAFRLGQRFQVSFDRGPTGAEDRLAGQSKRP